MKSLIVLGTVTAALAFPLLVSQPTTAHASQYSAARANSVRLVWRRSMKAHQFHTMRGPVIRSTWARGMRTTEIILPG